MYDISHAFPFSNTSDGLLNFSINGRVVSGPQKSIQSLVVELLSNTRPTNVESRSLLDLVSSSYVKDVATLSNFFVPYISEVLPNIDDTSRPDNERISSVSIIDFQLIHIGYAVVRLGIKFLSGDSINYEMPVRV